MQGNCGRAAALWFCLALKGQPYLLDYHTTPAAAATIRPTEKDEAKRVCAQGCTTFSSIECGDKPLPTAQNASVVIDVPQMNDFPVDGCMMENGRFCWQPTALFYCQLQGYADVASFENVAWGQGGVIHAQWLGVADQCTGADGKPTCTYFKRINCIPAVAASLPPSVPQPPAPAPPTMPSSTPVGEPNFVSSSSVPIGAIAGGVAAAAGEWRGQ